MVELLRPLTEVFVPTIEGLGSLSNARGDRYPGEFLFSHELNKRYALQIVFRPQMDFVSLFNLLGNIEGRWQIEGKNGDGDDFQAAELLFAQHSLRSDEEKGSTAQADFIARDIRLGRCGEATHFLFAVANMLFVGQEVTHYTDEHGERWVTDTLPLSIEAEGIAYRVALRRCDDYKNVEETLKTIGGNGITAIGVLQRQDGGTIACTEAMELLNTLFWLISFACGTKTSWVACSGWHTAKRLCYHALDAVLLPVVGLPRCIDPTKPGDLANFVNTTFPHFWKLSPKRREAVTSAIGAYLRSLYVNAFPAPIYFVSWAFETLIAQFVGKRGTYRSNKEVRKRVRQLIAQELQPYLGDLETEFGEVLDAKIGDLLRRPFRKNLALLLNQLKVPFSQNDIDEFVRIRNRPAIHGGPIKDSIELYETWTKGARLFELSMFRLLGYNGSYIDRTRRQGWRGAVPVPWVTPSLS